MPTLEDAFPTVCEALAEHFRGPPSHLIGLEPFEAMVAVLLEREIGRARTEAALDGLAEAGLLALDRLASADLLELRHVLAEKGISVSVRSIAPLVHLAQWLVDHHEGRLDFLFNPDRSTDSIRAELAAIRGVGLTAADAIVLFALRRPSYPVDRATFRVLVRHGWLDPTAAYDEARDLVVDHATDQGCVMDGESSQRLVGLTHGMEQLGRRYCRAAAPRCDQCPLESMLPEGGPREADG